MAVFQAWRAWFWDADFWLPENSTWQGLEEAKTVSWVQSGELYLCFPVAVALIVLRFLFERFIASPFARFLGVIDKPVVFVSNTFCEKVYQTITKSPNAEQVEGLSKQLGWSTREVKRWFKNRRQQSKPSLMKKATESSWRFVFYLATSIYGLVTLLKPLTDEINYYYLIEVGFTLSLLVSMFVDVKRKDFWHVVVHHIVTMMLTTFSYITGFFRIGCVIMLLHDLADIFLQSGKVFNYAKWEVTSNVIFIFFALVFNVTRLVCYPFWVLYAVYYSRNYIGYFPAWTWFLGLLLCLQVLNFYWSYKIAEMALQFAANGKVKGDVRSDEESCPEEGKVEMNKQDSFIPDNNKKKKQ